MLNKYGYEQQYCRGHNKPQLPMSLMLVVMFMMMLMGMLVMMFVFHKFLFFLFCFLFACKVTANISQLGCKCLPLNC